MSRAAAIANRYLRLGWHHAVAAAAALALLLPRTWNALPYVQHPDEPVNYLVAHRMVAGPTLLPHFYDYPSLQYDVQSAAHALVSGVGRLLGAWDGVGDLGLVPGSVNGNTKVASTAPWVVARGVSMAAALLGVALVVQATWWLTRRRGWAAAAGVLAAASGIGLAVGATITPDPIAGTAATATVVLLVSLLRSERVATTNRWAVATGVALGLAVGAKYNNAALVALVAVALVMARPEVRPTVLQAALLGGVAVLAFVLSTPAVVFDASAVLRSVRGVLHHYSQGHAGAEGGAPAANLRDLWHSDAPAVVLAASALVLRRTRPVVLLGAWVVGYFAVISSTDVHFPRNLTPLLGALAVLAGVGAAALWGAYRERSQRPVVSTAIAVVLAVTVAASVPGWMASRAGDVRDGLTDRLAGPRRWLAEQVPSGSVVLLDVYSPWLDPVTHRVTTVQFVFRATADQVAGADYAVVTLGGSGRFLADEARYPDEAAAVQAFIDQGCETREYRDGGYRATLVRLHCAP